MLDRPLPLTPRKALAFVNGFRALMLLVLLFMSMLQGTEGQPLVDGGARFYLWSVVYGALILCWFVLRTGKIAHTLQLSLAIAADILMIVLLMGMNGGVKSGYGMLLLPYLAVAGLLSSGRYALFYASIATASLFAYVGYEHVSNQMLFGSTTDLFQTGLLSLAGFVTSVVTYQLAKVARESEELALRRGGEIANLNRLNELVLQSQRDAVIVLDETGTVRQFNAQAVRYFPGMQRGILLPELTSVVERWRINSHSPMPVFVERNVRGRQLAGRMVPILAGDLRGVVMFLRDMADMAEEAKRIKLAALGRLTANIAHEIRNPLAAISHAGDLLAESAEDPATQRLTRIVRDNAKRINGLVEEVLMLGRRDRVKTETIKLSQFLADFLEQFGMAQPEAAGRILPIFYSTASVYFDRGHLEQILSNLVANAWRHSSRVHGAVRIEISQMESQVLIRVFDDGPGMSEDAQAHLFEPFFTTESSGTGLGLYIARELAEANDARLDYIPPGGVFRLSCHHAYE
ncbi:signal transduction histidine kinase [Aquitalea magnusonii]|jgi:two-component system sensor histidine kinase PilS (NtrC family)|uniref:histidine kinase n=1 Tax=Aquitalea magnusonii TaxID=332411 RepID=A0A3G9GPC2_9NEIS|nr:ATP-binding protein [Aquitalea magnusonii]BBF87621.1 signal transduction histidine kinase [Aquitalea magnusonii]